MNFIYYSCFSCSPAIFCFVVHLSALPHLYLFLPKHSTPFAEVSQYEGLPSGEEGSKLPALRGSELRF